MTRDEAVALGTRIAHKVFEDRSSWRGWVALSEIELAAICATAAEVATDGPSAAAPAARPALALRRECRVVVGEDDTCPKCGVLFSETCSECSRVGFHTRWCPTLDGVAVARG